MGRLHQSVKDVNIDWQKQSTAEQTVNLGLHHINLCFCVLVRSLLGETRIMLTQKGNKTVGGEVTLGVWQIELYVTDWHV